MHSGRPDSWSGAWERDSGRLELNTFKIRQKSVLSLLPQGFYVFRLIPGARTGHGTLCPSVWKSYLKNRLGPLLGNFPNAWNSIGTGHLLPLDKIQALGNTM